MKTCHLGTALPFGVAVLLANALAAWPPQAARSSSAPPTVPVHMVVTVEARHGTEVPQITREDVMVYQNRNRHSVTEWAPFQGGRAGLELAPVLRRPLCANL